MDIGKSKLSGQQAKLDSVNKLIDEVSQKKTKASVGIKTAGRFLLHSLLLLLLNEIYLLIFNFQFCFFFPVFRIYILPLKRVLQLSLVINKI